MTRKSIEHTDTFTAYAADGTEYTIFVFTEYLEVRSRDGTEKIEGLKSLQTSDGEHVNRIEKGKYRKIGFREVDLVSDDPNAL